MKMTVTQQRLQDEAADAILLSHWESEDKFSGETAAIDAALKGRLRELLKNGEFSGRLGQVSILHVAPGERVRAKRVVLMGLGKRWEIEHAYTYKTPEPDSLTAAFLTYLDSPQARPVLTRGGLIPCGDLPGGFCG